MSVGRKKSTVELNKREKAILRFIEKQMEKVGYAPSVREIGKAVDLKSLNDTIQKLNG